MPIDAMPFKSDQTSRGSSENSKMQKIPEKPVQEKPGPPEAPRAKQGADSAKESEVKVDNDQDQSLTQSVKETSSAGGGNQVQTGSTQESMVEPDGGSRLMNFVWYPWQSYNESRNWICNGKTDLGELLQRCDLRDKQLQKFTARFYQKQQGKRRGRRVSDEFILFGLKTNHQK